MNLRLGLRAWAALIVATSFSTPAAWGQWIAGVEVGADRFWGGSVQRAPERRSFRPYRPTTFGASLERRAGKVGVALQLHYARASLALEGGDAVVAVKGVFKLFSASPAVTYRIASLGPGNELLVRVGPMFELWNIIDEDSRVRIGGQGSLSLAIPLGGRFGGALSAGAALIRSPFNREDLDVNFDLRALWRRRVAAGLQYRL
jgi:hypothetical protein